jgi:hypothetical protein
MSADDYAVVVGISHYPNLDSLNGPENDARAFEAWLRAEDGGQVPAANITRILSSDPLPAPPLIPEPTVVRLDQAFEQLIDRSTNNGGKGGRRLYVYLAGHGFAPTLEDVVLLMANAAPKRTGHHLAGRLYANWFRKASFYDELVLIMDCCRENYPRIPVRPPPWEDRNGGHPSRYLYAYATQFSQASREGPDPDSKEIRGLFTLALLAGLRDAQRDAAGRLKTSVLAAFVYNYMQLTAEKVVGSPVEDPEFDYRTNREVVFDPVGHAPPQPVWTVKVHLTPANKGATVELVNGDGAPIASDKSGPVNWSWAALRAGLYRLRLNGQGNKFLELLGGGGVLNETL